MISGTTALIVEDEYLIALEVQRILEAAGATALIAAPGIADAIAPDRNSTFDLAIVAVPPLDADKLGLCEHLRRRGVAVVVLASGQEVVAEVGGFRLVMKPFTDNQLVSAVRAALGDTRVAGH
jgi:DNA-binding response OmpR family regulator